MAYIALARKYRPQSFKDLLSQEFITETLQNAVRLERVSHAYLFTGPRGVGKTSAARIYAKMLNCTNFNSQTLEPCGECDNCKEITSSSSMDVLEIDGASNRGVQEVRELRENVKFVPIKSKHKIVIIDEVHMLTEEAFNALLKTLEEPPEFVIFIFATTDLHKIPATILSRCQRYEFQKISYDNMLLNLKNILNIENIIFEEEALKYIIRASDGCMRDALSLLDQVIAYNNGKVQESTTAELLGEVNNKILMDLFKSIILKDKNLIPELIEDIDKKGVDYKYLTENLIEYCRNMLIYLIKDNLTDRFLSSNENEFYLALKPNTNLQFINIMFERLVRLLNELKYSTFSRYLFEFAAFDIINADLAVKEPTLENKVQPQLNQTNTNFYMHISQSHQQQPLQMQGNYQQAFSIWQKALELIGKRAPIIFNHMKLATVVEDTPQRIHLIFPEGRDFQCKLVTDPTKNSMIFKAVREITNMPTEIIAEIGNTSENRNMQESKTIIAREPMWQAEPEERREINYNNINMKREPIISERSPLPIQKEERMQARQSGVRRSESVNEMLELFNGEIEE